MGAIISFCRSGKSAVNTMWCRQNRGHVLTHSFSLFLPARSFSIYLFMIEYLLTARYLGQLLRWKSHNL